MSIPTATPTSSSTVVGETGGVVKRFAYGPEVSLAGFLPAGYVTDASVDYSTQVQAFFDYVAANHVRGKLIPIDIQIGSTINLSSVSNLSNFEIVCESSSGALASNGAYGTRWFWSGTGGTAFYLNNVRDAKVHLGIVMPKTTNTIAVVLDIDGANSTNLDIGVVGHKASGAITTGIRVANTSTSGNDLHDFTRCYMHGATTGVDIRDGQSKFHRFYGLTCTQCTTGVNQVDGSFTLYSPNFSANGVDVAITGATDSISIYAPQSELSGRFLYVPTERSAGQPVNIFGGRLTAQGSLNADGKYIVYNHGGPLNIIGVDFASGVYSAAWKIAANNNSAYTHVNAVNLIGCIFPNTTIWDDKDSMGSAVIGCRGVASDATQEPIPFLFSAGLYNTKAGMISAPAVHTLAADATAIDCSVGGDFITSANTGATAIATMSNARLGQVVTIVGGSSTNATTIADGGVFALAGAITLNANTTIMLKTFDGTNWVELTRSVN